MSPAPVTSLAFRAATHQDHLLANELWNRMFPDEAHGPEAMAHGWSLTLPDRHVARHVAERDGRPVGVAFHEHPSWDRAPDRYGRVQVWIPPEEWTASFAPAMDFAEGLARAEGTRTLFTSVREDQIPLQQLLSARGYGEKRRSRSWELDLVARRDDLLAARAMSGRRMRDNGITLTTWDQVVDPDKLAKLHAVVEGSLQDIPTTAPHVPEPLETFQQWIEGSPGLRPDRIWVALRGAEIVGVSMLEYPVSYGNVWTDYTGTVRAVRGQGVARALKYETVAQAIALGQKRVRTNNDAENAPILKLNEDLGYTRIPGWIQFHRAAGEA